MSPATPRPRSAPAWPLFALALAASASSLACSGKTIAIGAEADATIDDGGVAGDDGGAKRDGHIPIFEGGSPGDSSMGLDAPPPTCPKTVPTPGGSCDSTNLECEYGTSPSTFCDQIVVCGAAGWASKPSGTPCVTGSCPAAYPVDQVGNSCSPKGLACSYDQGTCTCADEIPPATDEGCSTSPCWQCFPKQTGCPSPRPTLGSRCDSPGKTCNYGACAGGVQLECQDGVWKNLAAPCPT